MVKPLQIARPVLTLTLKRCCLCATRSVLSPREVLEHADTPYTCSEGTTQENSLNRFVQSFIGRRVGGFLSSSRRTISTFAALCWRRRPTKKEGVVRVSFAVRGLPLRGEQLLHSSRTFPCPCSCARARAHRSRENLRDHACVDGPRSATRAWSRAVGVRGPRTIGFCSVRIGEKLSEVDNLSGTITTENRAPMELEGGARAALYLYVMRRTVRVLACGVRAREQRERARAASMSEVPHGASWVGSASLSTFQDKFFSSLICG